MTAEEKEVEPLFSDLNPLTPEKPAVAGRELLGKQDRKRFDNLAACMKSKAVPTKGAVGQMFAREATQEEKAAYAQLQRDSGDKDKFRLDWAKTKYEGLQSKVKEKSQTWQIVDEEVGEYMSISKAFLEEGGQPEDVEPTKKLARKLLRMGAPWSKLNPLTERVDIFYVRHRHRELLTQAWSLFERWESSQGKPAIADAVVATPAVKDHIDATKPGAPNSLKPDGTPGAKKTVTTAEKMPPVAAIAQKRQRSTSGTGRSSGGADRSTPLKRSSTAQSLQALQDSNQDKPLDEKSLVKMTEKLRCDYMTSTTIASQLLSMVDNDAKWSKLQDLEKWSKLKAFSQDLRNAKTAVDEMMTTSLFACSFVMSPVGENLRGLSAPARSQFLSNLQDLSQKLPRKLDRLNQQSAMLRNMRAQLQEAEELSA